MNFLEKIHTSQKIGLVVLLLLIASLPAGVFLSQQIQENRSLAATEADEEASDDATDGVFTANGPGTYQDDSTLVIYKGGNAWEKGIPGGDGTYANSSTRDTNLRLKFSGTTAVSVVLRRQRNAGKAKIIIKEFGKPNVVVSEVVDLYKPGNQLFETKTYSNLNPALVYRVRVKVTGTKNLASGGYNVGFDKFILSGPGISPTNTPVPTEDPEDDGIPDAEEAADELALDTEDAAVAFFSASSGTTTEIQETDTKVKYRGTWTAGIDGATTYKRANVKKNNARIKFKAKSVKVILRKSPDAGKARVVLRNLTTKTNVRKRVNLYSASVGYTTNEVFFDNLNKDHVYRVRVYAIGKRSANSTGNFVGLDKFIFTGYANPPTNTPILTPTPTPVCSTDVDTTDEDCMADTEEDADEIALDTEDAGMVAFDASGNNTTIIEQDNSIVKYKGGNHWVAGTDGSGSSAIGYKRAKVRKDNARIKFLKAKSVKVILRKSSDGGKARIILRNLTTKTKVVKRISLYSGQTTYTTDEIFFDNLDNSAVYRIRVVVLGRHRPASSGNFVGLDKFILTGNVSFPTATPTVTPGGPTPTPTDVPEKGFKIPVGDRAELTISIGSGGGNPTPTITGGPTPTIDPTKPHITFKTKLSGAVESPDIKARVKVVNLFASSVSTATAGTCQLPGTGEYFFNGVTLTSDDNGSYSPKDGTTFTILPGNTQGTVVAGGWIPLNTVTVAAGQTFAIHVKGEKHVNNKMVENFVLANGNPTAQNFDWSTKPLFAGDVPDPENDMVQNCTTNAADVSLVKNRILADRTESEGEITEEDLQIADLDYNEVLNSRDMSQMTTTLSTRPDDD